MSVVKKIGYAVIAIVVIILLLLWFKPNAVTSMSCGVLGGSAQDHCFKWAAETLGNPEMCADIKGVGDRGIAPQAQCYEDIAMAKKDIRICEMITEISIISSTPDKCAGRVVRTVGDKTLCNQLQDQATKDGCLAEFS